MKVKRCLTLLLAITLSVGVLGNINTVSAKDSKKKSSDSDSSGTTYTIKNDGKEIKKADLYKDSGLPSSFKGAKYYDVAMPYNLSAYDIGGWCIKAHEDGVPESEYVYDKKKLKSIKMSGNSAIEYSTLDYAKRASVMQGKTGEVLKKNLKVDKKTGLITTKINGVTFFFNVLQKFECNNNTAKKWNAWNKNGYLCDAILTDGTVIHFIKCDSNAECHTNGGIDGKGDGGKMHDDFGSNSRHKRWAWGEVKLKQYHNIFGVSGCNTWEIWGDNQKFMKHFNIGSGKNQNRLAYYRIYDIDCTETKKIKPASDDVKKLSYKLGDVTLADGNVNDKDDKNTVSLKQTGFYSETHYVELNNLNEKKITFLDPNKLGKDQTRGINDWKENVDLEEDSKIYSFARVLVMLCSIVFLVWILLIYLSYWFDRVNNFLDIALLPIVTFGHLRVSPEECECTFDPKNLTKDKNVQTVNHRTILVICLMGIAFAVFILSGKMYGLLKGFTYKILGWLGLMGK